MNTRKYTIVLVHGSWQTGQAFDKTVAALKEAGHTVYAPTIAGHGPGADKGVSHQAQVESIASYIVSKKLSDFVLVGHSYGGTIVAKLAEQMHDKIHRLVFWNAFVLKDKNCILDEVPPHFQGLFTQLHEASPDGSVILPFAIWREAFMNNASLQEAKTSYASLSTEPWSSLSTQLNLEQFYQLILDQKLACSYLHGSDDVALPPGETFGWYPRFANRLGLCRMVEFPGGNHAAYINHPAKTAEYLLRAIRD